MELGEVWFLIRQLKSEINLVVKAFIQWRRFKMNQKTTASETAQEADRVMLDAAKEFRSLVREMRKDYKTAKESRSDTKTTESNNQTE